MINLAIIRNIFIDSVINTDIAAIMEISECKQVLINAVLLLELHQPKAIYLVPECGAADHALLRSSAEVKTLFF